MRIQFATEIYRGAVRMQAAEDVSSPKRPDLAPGTAEWGDGVLGDAGTLWFVCPCGCTTVRNIPIRPPGSDAPGWDWDLNLTEPTLSPSILIKAECGWHGYLTKGEWRTC